MGLAQQKGKGEVYYKSLKEFFSGSNDTNDGCNPYFRFEE